MRKLTIAALFGVLSWPVAADIGGTDANGRPVILYDNGTWDYVAAPGTRVFSAEQVGLQDVDVYEYSYRNWNNANWGQWTSMSIGSNVSGTAQTRRRVFVSFDLPFAAEPLGPGDRVYLELNGHVADPGYSTRALVYRVTEPWSEGPGTYHSGQVEPTAPPGFVSWVNQPGHDPGRVWAAVDLDRPEGIMRVDVTGLVRGWTSGQWPNNGLVLIGESEGVGRYSYSFNSSEEPRADLRPRIVVERAAPRVPGSGPGTPAQPGGSAQPGGGTAAPTVIASGKGWRVSTSIADPVAWTQPGFGDGHWSAAAANWPGGPVPPQQIGNMADTAAVWIWEPRDAPIAFFRRSFTLDAAPPSARLRITADNAYTVYVNGAKLGEDTANLVSVWQSAEVYDVARLLRPGPNVIAVMAQNYGDASGLLVDLLIGGG